MLNPTNKMPFSSIVLGWRQKSQILKPVWIDMSEKIWFVLSFGWTDPLNWNISSYCQDLLISSHWISWLEASLSSSQEHRARITVVTWNVPPVHKNIIVALPAYPYCVSKWQSAGRTSLLSHPSVKPVGSRPLMSPVLFLFDCETVD